MAFPPFRAWLLVVAASLLLLMFCYVFFGRAGLFVGLLFSLIWNYSILLHKHDNALDYFSGKPLQGRDPWNLNESVEHYTKSLRIPKVDLFVAPSHHPLLLVSIAEWKMPQILISQGLIDLLTPKELDALVALAVATLKLRLTFYRHALERMAMSWMSLGLLVDQFLPLRDLKLASRVHYFVAWIHLKLAYPQSLQSKADLVAFQNTPHARDLATALWKIHGYLDTHPLTIPTPYLHQSLLGSIHLRRSAFQFILPIELRLRYLIGYFPI